MTGRHMVHFCVFSTRCVCRVWECHLYSTIWYCEYICTPYILFVGYHPRLAAIWSTCVLFNQVCVGCENVVCILLHGIVSIFYILISYPQCGAVCCSVLQCVAVCCSVFFQPGVRVGCENVVCILLLGIVCIFAHPALFLWFIIHNLPPYSPLVCCSTRCV